MVHGGVGAGVELRAVVHLGLGVLKGDFEDFGLCGGCLLVLEHIEKGRRVTYVGLGGIGLGNKAGEETVLVGLAGGLPVALHYAVVLGPEAELESVALVGLDVGGVEGQPILADDDDKVGGRGMQREAGDCQEDVAKGRHGCVLEDG